MTMCCWSSAGCFPRSGTSRSCATARFNEPETGSMRAFLDMLKTQRWDDHRYYHHSRINQTLHLISATTFLVAYGILFFDPAVAALIGWLIAMTTRQSGHFFFEPKC